MKKLRYLLILFFIPVIFTACGNIFPSNAWTENGPYKISVSTTITNGKIAIEDNVASAIKDTKITLSITPDVYFDLATLYLATNGKNTDIYPSYDEESQTCTFPCPRAIRLFWEPLRGIYGK